MSKATSSSSTRRREEQEHAMHVHMIGVCGTGMGSLAALFREQGHRVTGSDVRFDPPIGPMLASLGVECLEGYDEAHLERDGRVPDLVVVGNVVRKENPEALAAERRGLRRTSMSRALREQFLAKRRPLVVAGTHGKTTTSAMCALVLFKAGLEPGWFIGGVPKDLPASASVGSTRRSLVPKTRVEPGSASPFVVEGDEYDDVYWSKAPKFLDYVGVGQDDVVIVTSIEQDHIDIYPDVTAYEAAFRALVRAVPARGLLVCDARDARVRAIVREEARARVSFYALDRDETGSELATWMAAPGPIDERGVQFFDVFVGGSSCGRFALGVPGAHNMRNALAAIAAASEGFGVELRDARHALAEFRGVKRRQDLLGEPDGVRIYDDFAHHPTAVDETLRALRARHPQGALVAVFEPRSATACRALHQDAYTRAFDAADRVLFAPLGRSNIPDGERLDLARLASAIGPKAHAARDLAEIVARLVDESRPGDTLALLSNGAFGGLHGELVRALAERRSNPTPTESR
jgi:UDP-N-acetylmuramate: L-alanyl-gamma-D-glutamyl-meso-diaminopimelate ligase